MLALDGGVAVLAADGSLPALRERDLATRLDLLFAKGLHGVALNVAEAAKVGLYLLLSMLPLHTHLGCSTPACCFAQGAARRGAQCH